MSDRDYLYGYICRHGSLARSCQVCDLEDEVRQLRAELQGMVAESSWDELADEVTEVEADNARLRAAIREHDWRYTLDGGGRARCYPVMGELLPGDDDG
jgi:type II secretory pathway component PulK